MTPAPERVLDELLRMKEAHRLVLLSLVRHDSFDGASSRPALRWIAADSGLSLSRVQRTVKEMQAVRYIGVTRRGRDSFLYRILAARFIAALVGETQSPARGTQSPTGGTQSPAGGTGEGRKTGESSSTGSPLPRARDEKNYAQGSPARQARPFQPGLMLPIVNEAAIATGRAARGSAGGADHASIKELKRQKWLAELGQYFLEVEHGDLGQFWHQAQQPPDESRAYLNPIDARMRASHWWRERRAATGGSARRRAER